MQQVKLWKFLVIVLILCLLYYPALFFSYCSRRYTALHDYANQMLDDIIGSLL